MYAHYHDDIYAKLHYFVSINTINALQGMCANQLVLTRIGSAFIDKATCKNFMEIGEQLVKNEWLTIFRTVCIV